MSRRVVLATLLAMILGAVGSAAVHASIRPAAPASAGHAVMLLVDTSGSMNDTDGTSLLKIDGARRALLDFVRAIPQGTRVGLRTYPGGTETGLGGCSVGELRANLDNRDLSTLDATIRSLKADGDTPTAPALLKASEDLTSRGIRDATIVLVSDGLSTCGGDPCDVAGQIAASGIDVTVNTVGFRISDEGRSQLQCIAEKTQGLYADADNDAQLVDQLNQLSQPLLDVQLDFPAAVKAAVGADDNGLVTITATVTNVGASTVTAAQVTLVFTGDVKPVVLGPRRKLGNMAPGQTASISYQFRPPFGARDPDVAFRVDARGRNATPSVKPGSIRIDSELSLDDAGPLLKDAKRIAVLGDSYSAGEGAGSYLSGTDAIGDSCHRSRDTYAVPLWDAKASSGYHADVFACSGALSQALDFTNKDNRPEGPQVDHLYSRKPYDAVLMTIGGNDIGFAWIGVTCLVVPSCQDIHGSRLAAAKGLVEVLKQDYRTVEGSLNTGGNLDRRGRPGALIVLAYPNPMPIQSQLDCSNAFSIGEQRFFQDLVEELNTSARIAVETLAAEGLPVYFVPDTIDAFQPEHNYCGSQPYVNRLNTVKDLESLVGLRLETLDPTAPWQLFRSKVLGLPNNDTVKSKLMNAYQEQLHPNKLGYRAETVELIRWSTSEAARRPVKRSGTSIRVITNAAPEVTVSVDGSSGSAVSVSPGGIISVQGSGLPPSTQTTLTVQSSPMSLGTGVTDDRGHVTFLARVPSGLRPGQHRLVITADTLDRAPASISRRLDVRRKRPWWLVPLGGGGLLFLGSGGWLWRRSSRMPGGAAGTRPDSDG